MNRTQVAASAFAICMVAACSSSENGATGTKPSGRATIDATPGRIGGNDYAVCYEAPRGGTGIGALEFSDTTTDRGLIAPLAGMRAHATAVGDVNRDGWADLFVGTFADRPAETYRVRDADGPAPDRLLLGGSEGFRVDSSFPATRGRTSGSAFADLDVDGDLDLVVARNPREGSAASAPSVVYRNDEGTLVESTVLDERRSARSVGVLDFDDDGLLDLFLVEDRFGGGSSVLLRNDGDLRFTDATADAGLSRNIHGLGVAAGDLNEDTRPDLFVSGSNRLFVARGDGSFREVESPIPRWERYGDEDDVGGIAMGDVTGDGRPDLVVGQHYNSTVDAGRRVPVRLYLNEGIDESGSPQLRDVTEDAGLVALPTKAPHVDLADLDADGDNDIVTSASADGGTRPAVFRHIGVKAGIPRFEAPTGLGSSQYWPTGAVFDADHDGRLDVFMAEWDPKLPSTLFANKTEIGHWLGVQIGPAGTGGVGATVEVVKESRQMGTSELLSRKEITASTGYGAGAHPAWYIGLGDAEAVDIIVRPNRRPATRLYNVPTDRLIEAGSETRCGR